VEDNQNNRRTRRGHTNRFKQKYAFRVSLWLKTAIKATSKRKKQNKNKKIQPSQQVQLFTKHAVTHHTRTTEGIVGMDQGLKTSNTQKGKASPKTSTCPSYRSTSKATSYQRHQKQHLWQHKHICTRHGQVQEIQGNICTEQHCKDEGW
jgi:hypothetical protein